MLRKISFIFLFLATAFTGFSQANISTQAHHSEVTGLAFLNNTRDKSLISAGKDGFLIKWNDSGEGSHYQVSDIGIKKIARSPNGTDVAIYESNGSSIHRVSVWNWQTLTRKFAYRFNDTITDVNFSAKGTYLICTTSAVNGVNFINASTGNFVKGKISESSGVFTHITTSATEKSAIAYAPKGNINYYNLLNGQKKESFTTEAGLEQVCFFNNFRYMAGVKNNNIYVELAIGNSVGKFSASNPILVSSQMSPDLYYIINEGSQFKVFKIENDKNKAVKNPVLVRTFSGLKPNEKIICSDLGEEKIYAGTNLGNIYSFDYSPSERVDVQQPITDNIYEELYDIASYNDNFYFLTSSSVLRSSYDSSNVENKGQNPGCTNFILKENGAILWTKDSRKSVSFLDFASGNLKVLFTPETTVQVVKLSDNKLIYIEANKTVNLFDIESGKKTKIFSGTGIQDAVLVDEKNLFVAKSSSSTPNVPLIHVNIDTQETVPLNVKGDIIYSLNKDSDNNSEFYGLSIYTDRNTKRTTTAVFSYDFVRKISRNYLAIGDEDSSAFAHIQNSILYSNIGKTQVHCYNIKTKRDLTYKRTASMPVKIAGNGNRILVLNRDGSVSWYNAQNNSYLAGWFLNRNGSWSIY